MSLCIRSETTTLKSDDTTMRTAVYESVEICSRFCFFFRGPAHRRSQMRLRRPRRCRRHDRNWHRPPVRDLLSGADHFHLRPPASRALVHHATTSNVPRTSTRPRRGASPCSSLLLVPRMTARAPKAAAWLNEPSSKSTKLAPRTMLALALFAAQSLPNDALSSRQHRRRGQGLCLTGDGPHQPSAALSASRKAPVPNKMASCAATNIIAPGTDRSILAPNVSGFFTNTAAAMVPVRNPPRRGLAVAFAGQGRLSIQARYSAASRCDTRLTGDGPARNLVRRRRRPDPRVGASCMPRRSTPPRARRRRQLPVGTADGNFRRSQRDKGAEHVSPSILLSLAFVVADGTDYLGKLLIFDRRLVQPKWVRRNWLSWRCHATLKIGCVSTWLNGAGLL